MNENLSFEQFLADQITAEGSGAAPSGAIDEILNEAGTMRPLPRWLALIKEPPMRLSSTLGVGSPTVRVVAVMVATLLVAFMVAGAGIAGSRLLAADGRIVVDGSGSSHHDYTTITEAVANAEDGDEIFVKAGTYAESVTITEDITLHGEDRDSVIIQFGIGCTDDEAEDSRSCPDAVPLYDEVWYDPTPYGLAIIGSDAEISNVTFELMSESGGSGFIVKGGAPLIHDVAMVGETDFGNIYVHGGSEAKIRDSEFGPYWIFFEEQSPASIENSGFAEIRANEGGTFRADARAIVRGNRTGAIKAGGAAVVTENVLVAQPDESTGIQLSGTGWLVSANELTGFASGITIGVPTGEGTIEDNVLIDNELGISILRSNVNVTGNRVEGGSSGILVTGGAPTLSDNSVEGASGSGFAIGAGSTATLTGNTSCGNGENLNLSDDADPTIDDTNEFCPDVAAAE